MGVDISDILIKHETRIEDHSGMTMAVDSYNIIYQFLSSIRQPDGTPLMDNAGNVTSHLSGLFYRSVSLISAGLRLVYVLDGKPSSLKGNTLDERRMMREKNIMELKKAEEAGDEERIRSLSGRINFLTRPMIDECRELLEAMGIPVVQAKSEGEAQASYMNAQGAVDGVISQDYDCLLFGAKRVFRNMTFSGRRKVPGRNFYVNVRPEYIDLEENLSNLSIDRRQLIWIGMLTGTDFNRGVQRVGAKTGLNLIRKGNTLRQILDMKGASIESLEDVEDIFMNPPHEEWGELQHMPPNRESIMKILCERHNFSQERVSPYVDTLSKLYSKGAQKSLDRFF